MPGRIQDRIALVTGSSSGLGRAISLQLAAEGAKICCVDLYERPRNKTNAETGKADDFNNRLQSDESTVEEIQRSYGKDAAYFVKADMTDAKSVEAAVERCVELFGRLDIMCNVTHTTHYNPHTAALLTVTCAQNAGISLESTQPTPIPIHLLPVADWDTTFAINAKGVFLGTKYAIQQILKQELLPGQKRSRGWIVNTASIQGLVAYFCTPAYTASKGAVVQLTKQVALDYGEFSNRRGSAYRSNGVLLIPTLSTLFADVDGA